MRTFHRSHCRRGVILIGLAAVALGSPASLVAAWQATPLAENQAAIVAAYTLPDIALTALQNEALATARRSMPCCKAHS